MEKAELEALAEKYQNKADTAFQNYQETGSSRYETVYRTNEDMADALRMAAGAADDHRALVSIRAELSILASSASAVAKADEKTKLEKALKVVDELLSVARIYTSFRA